ncbi:hypothetical protein Tco_1504298 [Tanacetum coccineum]
MREKGLVSEIKQSKQNFRTHAGVLDLAQSVIDIITSDIGTVRKLKFVNLLEKNALVLTTVEYKGLEFQDVLLYNFFGTSTLRDQWRVLYGYMKKCDWLKDKLPQCFSAFHEARQCYYVYVRTTGSSINQCLTTGKRGDSLRLENRMIQWLGLCGLVAPLSSG